MATESIKYTADVTSYLEGVKKMVDVQNRLNERKKDTEKLAKRLGISYDAVIKYSNRLSGSIGGLTASFNRQQKAVVLAGQEMKKYLVTAKAVGSELFTSTSRVQLSGFDTAQAEYIRQMNLRDSTKTARAVDTKVKIPTAIDSSSFDTAKAEYIKNLAGATSENYKTLVDRQKQAVITQAKLNKGIKKGSDASTKLQLTWKSLVKLFAVQLAHRALATFTRAVVDGVRTLIEFEKKISEVQTISQSANMSIGQWTTGLRQLSDSFGLDVLSQTEAAYQALSNQVTNTADTFLFLKEANKLAVTTVATTEDAVNLLSSAINAFGLDVNDSDEISASFFKTVELGRVRLEDMANSLGRIAVPASKLGVGLHELQASITTATVQGITFKESSTLIRNILLKLIKPSEDMKDFFHDMGVESGEAAIQAYGLSGVLQKVEERTKGSTTEIGKLFGRLRAMTGAMIFSGDSLNTFHSNLAEIRNATKDYVKATGIVMETAGKKFEIELNKMKNFFIQDFAQDLLHSLHDITGGFDYLAESVKHLTLAFMPIATLVGSAGFLSVAGWLGKMTIAAAQAHPILMAVTTTISLISYGLIRQQQAAKDAWRNMQKGAQVYREELQKLSKQQDSFADTLERMGKAIKSSVGGALKDATKDLGFYRISIKALMDTDDELIEKIKNNYKSLNKAQAKSLESLKESVRKAENIRKNYLDTISAREISSEKKSFDLDLNEADITGKFNLIADKIKSRLLEISSLSVGVKGVKNYEEIKRLQEDVLNLMDQRIAIVDQADKEHIKNVKKELKIQQKIKDLQMSAAEKLMKLNLAQRGLTTDKAGKRALKAVEKQANLKKKLAKLQNNLENNLRNTIDAKTIRQLKWNFDIQKRKIEKQIKGEDDVLWRQAKQGANAIKLLDTITKNAATFEDEI